MKTEILSKVEKPYLKNVPVLRPGDTVRVHQKIKEGNKERVQVFEGVVLKVKGSGIRSTFLVRKISFGVGVEKSFPLHSPNIAKIEVKKRAKVRQAYLGYLRALQGKSARLKDMGFDALAVNVKDEPAVDPTKEVVTDAEITELSENEVAEAESQEVPLAEVEKAEEKQAEAEDKKSEDSEDIDHQVDEKEEIEAGVEKAEKDIETGKNKKDDLVEKNIEDSIG